MATRLSGLPWLDRLTADGASGSARDKGGIVDVTAQPGCSHDTLTQGSHHQTQVARAGGEPSTARHQGLGECLPTLFSAQSFLAGVTALGQHQLWLHESPRRDWAQVEAALGGLVVLHDPPNRLL